jgi:hypothetical protein
VSGGRAPATKEKDDHQGGRRRWPEREREEAGGLRGGREGREDWLGYQVGMENPNLNWVGSAYIYKLSNWAKPITLRVCK